MVSSNTPAQHMLIMRIYDLLQSMNIFKSHVVVLSHAEVQTCL